MDKNYYGINKRHFAGYLSILLLIALCITALCFRTHLASVFFGGSESTLENDIAQDGINFIKSNEQQIFQYLQDELTAEVEKKKEDRYYLPFMSQQEIYGYKGAEGDMVIGKSVASDSAEYKSSPLQIVCTIKPRISFTPSEAPKTPDDGRYRVQANIAVSCIGRIFGDASFSDLPKKEQMLSYETTFKADVIYEGDPQNYSGEEMIMSEIVLENTN